MYIHIEKTGKTAKTYFSGKASDLLKKLKINPETVMLVRNNELIAEDSELKNRDELKILSVVSGG